MMIRSMDLILLLGLNEAIDQLAMANSVCHVVTSEDSHICGSALEFEVGGEGRKGC